MKGQVHILFYIWAHVSFDQLKLKLFYSIVCWLWPEKVSVEGGVLWTWGAEHWDIFCVSTAPLPCSKPGAQAVRSEGVPHLPHGACGKWCVFIGAGTGAFWKNGFGVSFRYDIKKLGKKMREREPCKVLRLLKKTQSGPYSVPWSYLLHQWKLLFGALMKTFVWGSMYHLSHKFFILPPGK